jgi:hypothetical protein
MHVSVCNSVFYRHFMHDNVLIMHEIGDAHGGTAAADHAANHDPNLMKVREPVVDGASTMGQPLVGSIAATIVT